METNYTEKKTKWSIDQSQSEIRFKIKYLSTLLIEGAFKTFDANIYTEAKDFRTADVDLWIDALSIETGDEKSDNLLKSHDYLNVKNHNQITFALTTIGLANIYGNREIWGNLTLVGITQKVKLNLQFGGILNDPWGCKRAIFSIIASIKGSDWGLSWSRKNVSRDIIVSDEIDISCEIELKKAVRKNETKLFEPSTFKAGNCSISKHQMS